MGIRLPKWKSPRRSFAHAFALGILAILVPVTTVALTSSPTAAGSEGGATASASLAVSTTGGIGPYAGQAPAFDGTFSGTSLDTSQWQTCYPWEDLATGCTNFGNSQEQEWYLPSQDQVSGGVLHLVADATATPGSTRTGAPKTYPYRSGMVTTYSSFDFTYGYVQVTARIPGGTGTWPALWLLPQSEAWPPEIDIMENWGTPSTIRTTLHWGSSSDPEQAGQQVTSSSNLTAGWNTYGLLWQPGSITWYLDGNPVYSYTGSAVPSQPMYFLANLAIDGTASPVSSFDIQSVKIYDSSLPTSASNAATAPPTPAPEVAGSGNPAGGASSSTPTPTPTPSPSPKASTSVGYDMVASDGGVFDFGNAKFFGSMGGKPLNKPVVASAAAPTGNGYWEVAADGGIFSFGNAQFHGSMGGKPLNEPIVGMAADPATGGYWEVAADGGIFSFDAPFYGSMGGKPLNKPIVGMAVTKTGGGYWLLASDGGIFSFGNAVFHGSMGGKHLNQPIVGMAADPASGGYWFVASTGGVFSFDAPFHGSASGQAGSPVVGMAPAPTGNGYWIGDSTGQVLAEGVPSDGTMSGKPLNEPMIGFAVS